MREYSPERPVPRRVLRFLMRGLAYMGAFAWPCAEVVAVLRAEDARSSQPQAHHDSALTPLERVIASEDLSDQERLLFQELEAQFDRENEQ